MSSLSSAAATLRPETRQQIAIEVLSKTKPISHLATDYKVSRKFVYEQSNKAKLALDDAFEPTIPDEQGRGAKRGDTCFANVSHAPLSN